MRKTPGRIPVEWNRCRTRSRRKGPPSKYVKIRLVAFQIFGVTGQCYLDRSEIPMESTIFTVGLSMVVAIMTCDIRFCLFLQLMKGKSKGQVAFWFRQGIRIDMASIFIFLCGLQRPNRVTVNDAGANAVHLQQYRGYTKNYFLFMTTTSETADIEHCRSTYHQTNVGWPAEITILSRTHQHNVT